MPIFRTILFSILILCTLGSGIAQQRGQIIKAGDSVLDPNGDGFITNSGGQFSIDGYYVDEFEYTMFGIPFVGTGEVEGDGTDFLDCSNTDLAADTTGFSAYSVLIDDNLIFRFRLAGTRPFIKSYSILIDSDGLMGPADPDYNSENPGFEIAITFFWGIGINIYDLEDTSPFPTAVEFYPSSTHFQSSIAGTTVCDDPDYFYDFYISYQDLVDNFGLSSESDLRFVAVTSLLFYPVDWWSFITDVGGVNDEEFGSLEEMFLALTEDQCPSTIDDLCETCEGFLAGTTDKPIIDQPVKVGETYVTGTAEPTADIFMDVFDVDSNLLESITTTANGAGFWEITLSNPLNIEDSIIAKAQIEGNCLSGISESDLSYAVAVTNQAPTISGTTTPLNYQENDDPIVIFNDLNISDVDDTEIDSAWITFTINYNASEDIITLPPDQGLNISWESPLNRVKIYGQGSIATYESVIQGVTYSNSSENPDLSTRSFSITVHDGLNESNLLSRDLVITRTNDPPVLSGDAITIGYEETDTNILIDNTISITDVDDISLEGAIISFTQGYDQVEDTLLFVGQNGIIGSFDDMNGILTLTGAASLADYQTALRGIRYENLHAGNDLVEVIDDGTTRVISFEVDDGGEMSNIYTVNLDINIAPNIAPIFVDNLVDKNPLDTVIIDLLEDTVLDTCLAAYDVDGDLVILQPGFTYENNQGLAVITGNLCFTFTPNENFNGSEYISFVGCDDATSGSLCDDVVVEINIIPVNDPPDIVDGSNNPIDTLYFNVLEDTPANFCIDAIDIESNTVEFTDAISISGNGVPAIGDPSILCFDYQPDTDFFGNDTLYLVVCEQGSSILCDTIIAIIEIDQVNDPPVIEFEGAPVDTLYFEVLEDIVTKLCVGASDADMDNLEVTAATLNEGPGIFEPLPLGDLCFFFQSEKDSTGMVYGEITVCDNQNPALCDIVIAAVNILPVNDPPSIIDEDGNPLFNEFDTLYYTLNEDEPFNFCIDARDADGDPIELTDAVSVEGNGSYEVTDPINLCTTITPNPDFNGRESVILTVCETVGADPKCDSIAVVFDILPVNDPPIILNGSDPVDTLYFATNEDSSLEICLDANDIDNNQITLNEVNTTGANGIFDPATLAGLCITFIPNDDFNGEVIGEFIVCDDQNPALCDTVIVIVDVLPVKDPPGFLSDQIESDTLRITTQEDTDIEFCFEIGDPDSSIFTDPILTSSTNLGDYSSSFGAEICYEFSPLAEVNGAEYSTIEVCDDDGLCSELIVEIVIEPVNDPPVGEEDFYENDIYTSFTGDLSANDFDPEGTRLQISLGDGSKIHGVLELETNGQFGYTPSRDFEGTEVFTYLLCDEGTPEPACVSVSVSFVLNDPLIVWQALSPNGDNMNDQWIIEGIDLFPDNKVQVFDRYNNVIFEADGYNNLDIVWYGQSNRGLFNGEAPNGTYFYRIDLGDEKISKPLSGFVILKKD
ncbi:MAG: tandem-95 repeat protein [Bacteroidota bacterium]